MREILHKFDHSKVIFYHLSFNDVEKADHGLYYRLNKIATNFKIDKDQKESIDRAVEMLLVKDNSCLRKIKDIVLLGQSADKNIECQWSP